MAAVPAQGTACLSLRNGCRCVPEAGVTVEDLLVAVGQKVGFDNIISGSRMNKAVVVFLKAEALVNKLTVDGLWVKEAFVPVSPLSAPATKITISNVPPFVSNVIINELLRFGKIASPMRMIPLGCKNTALKHVMSFRRQIFMFLSSQDRSLEVSFRVKHEDNSYMVYASSESLKCFDCGDVGHKRFSCPHKVRDELQSLAIASRAEESNGEPQAIERNRQDTAQIDRVTEEVKEKDEVSGSVSKSLSDDQPGCSYAVEKPASACGAMDRMQVNECSVEDVLQYSLVTQAKCLEEDEGDEMDGLSQSTEDSVRDEQWSEMERVQSTVQRVVRLAERISGSALPSLQVIYLKRCRSRAAKILKDSTHPGNRLFILLPSGRRFRSMMAKTERLRKSFFPQAIRLLNTNSVS